MEMVLILATMISRVRMELVPGQNFKLIAGVTLKPESGMQVKIRKP
jgi:hypothetical protein